MISLSVFTVFTTLCGRINGRLKLTELPPICKKFLVISRLPAGVLLLFWRFILTCGDKYV